MTATGDRTVVITVSTIAARSQLIKRIYTNATKEPPVQFTVVQDQVNRIRIFHNVGPGIKVLILTYLVIVIPIIIDLKSLNDIYGLVDFHLNETISDLQALITKLTALQGQRIVKGNDDGETLRQLVDSLL